MIIYKGKTLLAKYAKETKIFWRLFVFLAGLNKEVRAENPHRNMNYNLIIF